MKTLLLLSLSITTGIAQYPGQTPGGYPPGQQGPGIPMPRRSKGSSTQKTQDYQVFRGVIRSIDSKNMEVGADDERILTIQINDKTKKPDKLVSGDKVEIDAFVDDNGGFVASEIKKTGSAPKQTATSATPSAAAPASEPAEDTRPATVMATPVPSGPDDESGPPKLKRGIPKPKKPQPATPANTEVARTEPPPASVKETAAPTAPSAESAHADEIAKAREASENFLSGLPNYVVQQFTTRYVSSGRKTDWQAQDVVSADVIWEAGKERYEHLAINGKQMKQSAVEEKGAWSWGEFGTVLQDVFAPASAADFKYRGSRSMQQKPAFVYEFDVDHPHSHWTIQVPGQRINPAYHGSIWIEKETGRVLRLEMQAIKVPAEFPNDKTEMAVDYDYMRIGAEKYLLPVKSEMLSCERGSTTCERNVIEFRNYHRFAGQSDITFH